LLVLAKQLDVPDGVEKERDCDKRRHMYECQD
jgi:hypothetical protein